jgi:hypothetical protein
MPLDDNQVHTSNVRAQVLRALTDDVGAGTRRAANYIGIAQVGVHVGSSCAHR